MTRHRLMTGGAVLALALTLACSGGGITGPTGTSSSVGTTIIGTTGVAGTASAARLSAAPAASEETTDLRICVHGTTTCAPPDSSGRFQLEGDFNGDVQLDIMDGDTLVAGLIIPGVVQGETIVIRIRLEDERSQIEIISRSGDDRQGDDDSTDDGLSEDDSADDMPSDDASEDRSSSDAPAAPVTVTG